MSSQYQRIRTVRLCSSDCYHRWEIGEEESSEMPLETSGRYSLDIDLEVMLCKHGSRLPRILWTER